LAEISYIATVYLGNGQGGYTRADTPDEAVNALIHEALAHYAHTLALPGTPARVVIYTVASDQPVQVTPVGVFEDRRGDGSVSMSALATHAAPVYERRSIVFPPRSEAISA